MVALRANAADIDIPCMPIVYPRGEKSQTNSILIYGCPERKVTDTFHILFQRRPIAKPVQRYINNSEKQCLIFVSGQGGGRRQCGGIVD